MLPSEFREIELRNGFRAILVERRSLPVVASTLWYRVGSRDERTGETGLSHFLEHMMFKGTERYAKGEIDLLTAKLGGSNNAFTSCDVTAYYFALASDRWETALEIEASRMRGCSLDEAEFAAEKSVVLEELAMGEDDPWSQLYHAIEGLTFQVHPYHHPVIGWREDLERLDAAGMRAYYERNYGPNRAFLSVVGDIDLDRAERRVRKLFGKMPAGAAERAPVVAEPRQRGERRAVRRFPSTEKITRMCIAFPTCKMGGDDDFALDVASVLLGSEKTGTLYKRLVQQAQLATHVSVANEVRLDPGVFCVTLELREGASPEKVEAMVREEIDKLATRRPAVADLRRARTQLRSFFLFEEETVLDVALRLGRFETGCDAGYRLLAEVPDRYERVDGAAVSDVIRRYCQPDMWNVVWLLPESTKNGPKKNGKRSR